MSTIQNLKNFIRHGKQAKQGNAHAGDPTTNLSPVHAHQYNYQQNAPAISEPNVGQKHQQHQVAPLPGEYSAANVDNRNIAAQAGGAAAKVQGDNQKIGRDDELRKIVEEERLQRGKMPKYPGLERWILMEKMGDGAFSNVYRAKDSTGQSGEVAIKVVRKFEMNANQVRRFHGISSSSSFLLPETLLISLPYPCQRKI